MDSWNNRIEKEKDKEFAQEPTNEEPMIQRRRIRPAIKDVGSLSEKPMTKGDFWDLNPEQDTLDIAKNSTRPTVWTKPKHTPSR